MSAHMGRDFGKLNLVSPIILFQCIMKIFFPVKRHFRLPVFVQKQKTCFSAYKRFDFWFWPSGNDPGKAIVDLVSHRNITDTTLCLWIFDNLLHLRCALQLMINVDHAGTQIDIVECQAGKFGNAQAGFEQDAHAVVIL